MEVLNIANVNSSGQVVLNDHKLLELILRFPYLYSPEVNPFGDADYDDWAWEHITAEFNNSYANGPCVAFTISELRQRWSSLQPIVLSLSKMVNLNDIPESFQHMLKKIGSQLEMSANNNTEHPFTTAQNIILKNIGMVEKLPLMQRRSLEAEIMELILNSEVESKCTLKMGPADEKRVERECEEFMKTIDFKETSEFDSRSSTSSVLSETEKHPDINECLMVEMGSSTNEVIDHTPSSSPITTISVISDDDTRNRSILHSAGKKSITPLRVKLKRERWLPTETLVIKDELLQEPIQRRRYIPLDVAKLYVRNCVVRIKRCHMPVRKIKREQCVVIS